MHIYFPFSLKKFNYNRKMLFKNSLKILSLYMWSSAPLNILTSALRAQQREVLVFFHSQRQLYNLSHTVPTM